MDYLATKEIVNPIDNSIDDFQLVQLANAATQRPQNSSYCEQLIKDIKVLSQGGGRVNVSKYEGFFIDTNDSTQKFDGTITKSIYRRYVDLIVDSKNLAETKPYGKDSYTGHQKFLESQQAALASAVTEYVSNCDKNGNTRDVQRILGQAGLDLHTPVPTEPDRRIRALLHRQSLDVGAITRVVVENLANAGINLANAGVEGLKFVSAIVGAIISTFLGPDRQMGQTPEQQEKAILSALAQLNGDKSSTSSTQLSQGNQPKASIDRSTASAEELLENAYKVAAGIRESGRGESPEFKELMKQLDEQRSKLTELNQVADQDKPRQNQREMV